MDNTAYCENLIMIASKILTKYSGCIMIKP